MLRKQSFLIYKNNIEMPNLINYSLALYKLISYVARVLIDSCNIYKP